MTSSLSVLYMVPYVPSPIRVRPFHLIRQLSQRGHQVTLATVWSGEEERAQLEQIEADVHQVWAYQLTKPRIAWNLIAALLGQEPLQAAYSWHPALAAAMRASVNGESGEPHFDVVHVEHLRGAKYGLSMRRAQASAGMPAMVWDSVDCISYLFRQTAESSQRILSRWIARFELGRTERFEASALGGFDRVLVTSQSDQDAFETLVEGSQNRVQVLPNGVDVAYFAPDPSAPRQPDTIVMSGKMSYHANVTMAMRFVKDVWPRIKRRRPDVQLWIVGKDPPREVRSLAADSSITVTGTVPDIRDYLRRASLAVAPVTYGAGIQNKVLEAMACETPVVASPIAVSALRIEEGEDVLVGRSASDFADKVIQLLEHKNIRRRMGRRGRRYVISEHEWSAMAARLEEIYYESSFHI